MNDIFDIFKKLELNGLKTNSKIEYIVVGLGNPGVQYAGTRHNVGFEAVDAAAYKLDFKVNKIKFKSLVGETNISSKGVLFMKPSTYMNLSGQAVMEAVNFYKIPIENVIVICDDVSLAAGKLRIRSKGSAGGHNGLKNIIYLSGVDTFPRVKIGVGEKPHPDYDLADWVLSKPMGDDKEAIAFAVLKAYEGAVAIISNGIDSAMNAYNR